MTGRRAGVLRLAIAVAVALTASSTQVLAHECAHAKIERAPRVTTTQLYSMHAHDASASADERQRRLAETVWEPIRIKVEYSNFDASLTSQQVSFVQNTLVPAAVDYWQKALTVDRVDGNLFAERHCTQTWNTNGKCKTYATVTRCGSHSNTGEVAIPDSMFKSQEVCSNDPLVCSNTAGGAGVANADFVLFVTANSDSSNLCPGADGDTLAFASSCQFDQHDRPSFARANFCPYHISTDPNDWEHQLSTAVHELAHALGFSSDSLPYFRDEVGDPRTPREADGSIAAANVRTFSCDGSTLTANVPSTSTVQYFAERGHDSCDWRDPSSCVMKMVTPKVVALSRVFFGCNSLQGAELENQPTSTCSIMGSHWEARLFMDETMAAFASHNPFTSPVTLALFEDSGWYRANYSMATPLQSGVHWGFQQGCDFALNKCVAPKAAPVSTGTPAHFCADITTPAPANTPNTCSLDRRAKARCSQATWNNLPAWYQYFENSALAGGFQTADFCPYKKPFSDQLCRNPSHAPTNNYQGETFDQGSLCMSSTLNQAIGGFEHANPQTGCYQVECVSSTLLRVTVKVHGGTAQTVECSDGATQHSVPGFTGVITCINPARFCAKPVLVTSDTAAVPGVVWLSRSAVKVANAREDFVTLQVTRVLGSRGGARVTLNTRDGTAKAGRHFRATNVTVSWADGESGPKSLQVPLLPTKHRGEQFYVDLVSAVNVTLSEPSTTRIVLGDYIEKAVDTNGAAGVGANAVHASLLAMALAVLALRRQQ